MQSELSLCPIYHALETSEYGAMGISRRGAQQGGRIAADVGSGLSEGRAHLRVWGCILAAYSDQNLISSHITDP